jgi:hypothetical protein
MHAANFVLSTISLFVGAVILFLALSQSGLDPTSPTLLGLALLLNGAIRLWFLKDERPPA